MIPAAAITAWGNTRPWPSREQVEQDLLLARTIVSIYNHPLLRKELVFCGGTCLHQVRLPSPLRYSEDLDFVRRSHTQIGPIFDALREIAGETGLSVHSTSLGPFPKMRLEAPATNSSAKLRIKIEINTHETSPAQPLVARCAPQQGSRLRRELRRARSIAITYPRHTAGRVIDG